MKLGSSEAAASMRSVTSSSKLLNFPASQLHLAERSHTMKRRDFLKLGVLGTGGALLGWDGLADAAQQAAGGRSASRAVYRTLAGRG